LPELLEGDFAGIRTQAGKNLFKLATTGAAQSAEAASVAVANLPDAVVQDKPQVGVGLEGFRARHDQELPGHAQAHDEIERRPLPGPNEADRQNFALALYRVDPPAAHGPGEIAARAGDDPGMEQLDGGNPPAERVPFEAAPQGFDFGKLRHTDCR
jgi:hypothetical protein